MGSFSLAHWLAVLFVVVLLFGPKRLAGLGKSIGEGIRGLKRGVTDEPSADSLPEKRA
jgi:sec-independent protein translocase protein TatA